MASYDAKKTEEKIRKFWEKEEIYKFDSKKKGEIYSIDTPPPNISGKMHMGHAFSYSQQDFIARFRRMFLSRKNKGQVFYPFGTDDNGLPTERLVEKLKKVKSKEMSREEFIKLSLKVLKKLTPEAVQDWKNLGLSCDFDIFYSTIDNRSRKISQKSFLELYGKGEIYKAEFPTIWCPECQTSIAQAELEDKEFPSIFSTIKFSVGKEKLLIATTRPELIPACVAIFVNPKDKRYKNFIGKKAKVPLFDFTIPVIGDRSAEIGKGTGVMMVCSYGDKYDVEAVLRHKLNPKIIFSKDGTLNEKTGNYRGMKIKEARKEILNDLKENGLVVKKESISHVVNVHDKCGTPIEFLPTEQWFIKILDKKKKLIQQGKKIEWYPKHMRKRYENWVNGLEWDWNISRDRHFGVPIPVWYCEECKEILLPKEKELPVDPIGTKKKCPKCKKEATPEKKVLDTWATSSLTPRITSSLIKDKVTIPYSLRPQAHDIIRTWAFYTIVKSYLHENKIPWKDIVISGFVTTKGEKMSKSKGNAITPEKIIEEFGADGLRFWAAGSKLGEDLEYQEKDLVTGKKFVNKLRNAARFVFMNLGKTKPKKPRKLERTDELFLNKLDTLIKSVTYRFEIYEYSKVKLNVEIFFWKMFTDNYIELVKKRVYQGKGNEKLSAQYTLYKSLLTILKLIAPIMPFITEEIYQEHFRKFEKDKSIHIGGWPEFKDLEKERYDGTFGILNDRLTRIRTAKTKAKKSMNSEIILTISKEDHKKLKDVLQDLKNVTNAKEIKEGKFKVEFTETGELKKGK